MPPHAPCSVHVSRSTIIPSSLPPLVIGDLEINPPIIQGGMGVRVSGARLAAAVANEGCAGIIASVGLGRFEDHPGSRFETVNEEALRQEIRTARTLSDGIIGVNIMVALTTYGSLVRTSVEEGVDFIVSGAGLPLELPGYVGDKPIKLIPIVSSGKALSVICKRWKRDFDRLPDAVIVEGSRAGGHLGFPYPAILNGTAAPLEQLVTDVLAVARAMPTPIPVIAGGGVFNGDDIARFLHLGASGVQMATRFVCTHECDVHDNFKMAYINAREEDMTIISSPVGLPGRVINNSFVERIKRGETIPFTCSYRCLRTCDPRVAPFCIAKVLTRASSGDLKEAFAFAGANAYRCDRIVSVHELVAELTEEAAQRYHADPAA